MSTALLGPDPDLQNNPYVQGFKDNGIYGMITVWASAPGYGPIYFSPTQLFEQDMAVLWMDAQRKQRILDAGKTPVLFFQYYPGLAGSFQNRMNIGIAMGGGAFYAYGYQPASDNQPLLAEYQRVARQQIINDIYFDATGKKRVRLFTSDGIPAFRFTDMKQALFASNLTEQERIDNAALAVAERYGLSPQQLVDISEAAPTNPIAAQYTQALIQQRLTQLGLAGATSVAANAAVAAGAQPGTLAGMGATIPVGPVQITVPAATQASVVLPPTNSQAGALAANVAPPVSAVAVPSTRSTALPPTGTQTGMLTTAPNILGIPTATIDQTSSGIRIVTALASLWFLFKKR
jgi:hypothetical protein